MEKCFENYKVPHKCHLLNSTLELKDQLSREPGTKDEKRGNN